MYVLTFFNHIEDKNDIRCKKKEKSIIISIDNISKFEMFAIDIKFHLIYYEGIQLIDSDKTCSFKAFTSQNKILLMFIYLYRTSK